MNTRTFTDIIDGAIKSNAEAKAREYGKAFEQALLRLLADHGPMEEFFLVGIAQDATRSFVSARAAAIAGEMKMRAMRRVLGEDLGETS